ncbi:hypothetical protein BJY01DRAFT_247722 [Aspergillus pseudoustus]|uniref:Nephrocystin 3-like N-terminal domain-containing protein n=1 Tax=Aspergillus pseudoustus TaxID=1810923 RepID=A0ABR4JZJ5_9EURO
MELAASILGVIELAGGVATVCGGYIIKVKHAQKDILRLNQEIVHLKGILEQLDKLRQEPGGEGLTTFQGVSNGLVECSLFLQNLGDKINPDSTQSKARRFGIIRALKWPLHSTEVDDTISRIMRYTSLFQSALSADQWRATNRLEQKFDLQKLESDLRNLPIAKGAAFDYHGNGHKSCLDGTRNELLDQVEEWAASSNGKFIFWIKGGAGTGKSTVSQTISRRLEKKRLLGGSFFFRQGEADRDTATRLFPTLVQQLAERVPELKPEIQRAIEDDPRISERGLAQQFRSLVVQPFEDVSLSKEVTLVVVIDALDECGSRHTTSEDDIQTVLKLLPLMQASTQAKVKLRFLLTSRPEMVIRSSLREITNLQKLDLFGDIPTSHITRDISLFLKYAISDIQEARGLSANWPGDLAMQILLDKTVPLFISAVILCRFIKDAFNPRDRLRRLLADESSYVSEMAKTYLPVLKQLLSEKDEKETVIVLQQFREVVGPIIMLATPLSVNALSGLLAIDVDDIKPRLDWLHSVLSVPEDCELPVRLIHLSFRDFLLDESTRKTEESKGFWIDKVAIHTTLTEKCLETMNRTLTKNICQLSCVGYQQKNISPQSIQRHLPPDLQYACRYWTRHLVQSQDPTSALADAYPFLEVHFLHWVEVMSILGLISEAIEAMNILHSVSHHDEHTALSELMHDARRFILKNRQIAELAPLQLYSSALMFCPTSSIIRRLFKRELSITAQLPEVEESWSAELQTLEGHTDYVQSVCVSPDGQQLASASEDGTIKLWYPGTGQLQQTLSGHSEGVGSVRFSHDGQQLVSGSYDGTVKLWDPTTGGLTQTFKGNSGTVHSICISPDGQRLAFGSDDGTVKLWEPGMSRPLHTLRGNSGPIFYVAFSPNGQQLVSGSERRVINLWDTNTGQLQQTLEGHSGEYDSVSFSSDGQQLASGSDDGTITLWVPTRWTLRHATEAQPRKVTSVAFSPDSRRLASATDGTVEVWNLTTRTVERTFEDPSRRAHSVTFSPTGKQLAFIAHGGIVRILDLTVNSQPQTFTGPTGCWISSFCFLPDSQQLATGSDDKTIRLWDLTASRLQQPSKDDYGSVKSICCSSDGQQVASGSSKGIIKLWDPTTGKMERHIEAHDMTIQSISFSASGHRPVLLASGSSDMTIKLWDPKTGRGERPLYKMPAAEILSLRFSPDNRLVSGLSDGAVKVWNISTGQAEKTIQAHDASVESIAFTTDCHMVSGSADGTSKFWSLASTASNVPERILKSDYNYRDPIRSISISTNGEKLACSSSNGPTRLWDIRTAQLEQTFNGHSNWTWSKTGSSVSVLDGQWICIDGERKLWLPKQYRANCLVVIPPENPQKGPKLLRIAIGHPSGRVSFLSILA